MIHASTEKILAEIPNVQQQLHLLYNQTDNERARLALVNAQVNLTEETTKLTEGKGSLIPATKALTQAQAAVAMAQVPGAENEAAAQTKYKNYFQNVSPFLGDTQKAIGSAASAARLLGF